MIKLTKWEETILLAYLLDSDKAKTYAIRDINSFNMPIPFESKLLLTQAILDGEWEVEEIKLTKWEETILLAYLLDSDKAKTYAIRDINSFNMPIPFESKLLLTQAILDGEWEVEESMTLDEFKEEYKMLKCKYNKMRLNGDITANRVYQEAVVKLVKEFLEEVGRKWNDAEVYSMG